MSSVTTSTQPIAYVTAPSLVDVKAGNAVLQKGHKGAAVSYVQDLLRIHVDTKFGGDTEAAVIAFQQHSGLSVPGTEGKVDRALLAAIEAASGVQPEGNYDYDERHKLEKVHAALREKAIQLAARLKTREMSFLITDGIRTFAEQDQLFRKGRKFVNGHWKVVDPDEVVTKATGGLSNHNYGLAFDSYPVIKGKVYTDIPKNATHDFKKRFMAIQTAIGEEGEAVGLFWGGRWSDPYDPPHLQLFPQTEMKVRKCLEIYEANGNSLAAVWAEVDRVLS